MFFYESYNKKTIFMTGRQTFFHHHQYSKRNRNMKKVVLRIGQYTPVVRMSYHSLNKFDPCSDYEKSPEVFANLLLKC